MRRIIRRRLPQGMARPYRMSIYLVETTSLVIPEWAYVLQLPDFDREPQRVWVPRFAAKILAQMDREDGGNPSVIRCQYRRCPVCKRLAIQLGAEDRRRLSASYAGEMKVCGPECQQRANQRKRQQR